MRNMQNNENNLRKNRGFTLLELMIVVGVIGILAAVAIPSYLDSVQKSRRADAYDSLLSCAASQARYFSSATPSTYFNTAIASSENLCGWNGTAFISKDEHYTMTIENDTCTQNNSFWCYTLTATPQGAQADDTRCATFTIDQSDNREARDSANAITTEMCWRN